MKTLTAWRESIHRRASEVVRSDRRARERRQLRVWFEPDALKWRCSIGYSLEMHVLEQRRHDLRLFALGLVLQFRRARRWTVTDATFHVRFNNRSLARAWFILQIQ